jgi:hypothetical protein
VGISEQSSLTVVGDVYATVRLHVRIDETVRRKREVRVVVCISIPREVAVGADSEWTTIEADARLIAWSGRIAESHRGVEARARAISSATRPRLVQIAHDHLECPCTTIGDEVDPVVAREALVRRTNIFGEVGARPGARRTAHRLTLGIHPRHDIVPRTVAVVVDAVGAERHRVLDREAGASAPAVGVTAIGVSVTVVVDVVVAVISFVAEGDAHVSVAHAAVRRAQVRGVLTRSAVDDHVGAFTAAGESENGGEKTGPKEGRAVHAGHDASFRSPWEH